MAIYRSFSTYNGVTSIVGQNHLMQSLFYNKVLNISCNLFNIVLKVKTSGFMGTKWLSVSVFYPRDRVAD